MELYDIIKKLNGSLTSKGESNYDEKVLENLKELQPAMIALIKDLVRSSQDADRVEASRKECGKKAKYILGCIIDEIGEWAK